MTLRSPTPRRFLALAGATALVALLAGCGNNQEAANTAKAPSAPQQMAQQPPPPPAAPVKAPVQQQPGVPTGALAHYDVQFASGSADLSTESRATLKTAAAYLGKYPGLTATLIGYASPSGPAALNQRLSKQRAANVAAFLKTQGVDEARLTIEAKGETEAGIPPAGQTKAAWARRVALTFHKGPPMTQ
jgi:outer membrane protein OmpA-like peptidoglycan-associated protein